MRNPGNIIRGGTALLFGASFLGACAETGPSAPTAQATTPAATPDRPSAQQTAIASQLETTAFNQYGRQFVDSRTGQIALGMCIAWNSSVKGEITVTFNPGVDQARRGGVEEVGVIFSNLSSTTGSNVPQATFLDGPYLASVKDGSRDLVYGPLVSEQDQIMTFVTDPKVQDPSANRHISSQPIRQPNGNWAYTDLASGQPVIETVVTDGFLTNERVLDVCNQLDPGFGSGTAQSNPLNSLTV